MALALTMGTLVSRCSQRASEGEGDSNVEGPEVKSIISEYYGELHALVSDKGARYFETEATLDLNNLALPSDHLSTIGVDLVLSGTTGPRRPVWGPIGPQERTYLIGSSSGGPAYFWAEEGTSLALYPTPTSGTYKHLYVPQPTDLSTAADSTSVDLINIYGQRLVIWGVASVIQHRGSASQERSLAEYKRAVDAVEYWACQRALLQPIYRIPSDVLEALRCGRWRWPR
jgi:hypothetical protein